MRLDKYVLEQKLVDSRNKAMELIKNGKVEIDGEIITKQSFKVVGESEIKILSEVLVSRAGWKLKNYIEKYDIKVEDLVAIDIGASTGGFSEVLLDKGIKKVICVDVGTNQLHSKIKNDKRVESYESCDIRDFKSDIKFDLVVSDVSFISLNLIIDKIDELSKSDIILLFKPQFEVGKDAKRDSKGVVLDNKLILDKMREFEKNCDKLGWKILRKEKSSVVGKEGNQEWIYHFRKDSNE